MQPKSLVTPTDNFLSLAIPDLLNLGAVFHPSIPKKGDIYVCQDIYIGLSGRSMMVLEDLSITKPEWIVEITTQSFVEIQPPTEVKLEEILDYQLVNT